MHNWIAVLIAFGVFAVGYAQWRTANQRVVLDLFDRRMKVFGRIEAAVIEVMREGAVENETFHNFATARADARFLFGGDVLAYLKALNDDFIQMVVFTDEVIDAAADREAKIDKKYDALGRIAKFAEQGSDVFAPYMAMTQKSTPFWRPW